MVESRTHKYNLEATANLVPEHDIQQRHLSSQKEVSFSNVFWSLDQSFESTQQSHILQQLHGHVEQPCTQHKRLPGDGTHNQH